MPRAPNPPAKRSSKIIQPPSPSYYPEPKLTTLQEGDRVTHTSDYFPQLAELCEKLIREGKVRSGDPHEFVVISCLLRIRDIPVSLPSPFRASRSVLPHSRIPVRPLAGRMPVSLPSPYSRSPFGRPHADGGGEGREGLAPWTENGAAMEDGARGLRQSMCSRPLANHPPPQAYADDTEQARMRQERWDGIASAHRDDPPELSLAHFAEMRAGSEEGQRWCVRAKISVSERLLFDSMRRGAFLDSMRRGAVGEFFPRVCFCLEFGGFCHEFGGFASRILFIVPFGRARWETLRALRRVFAASRPPERWG